MLYEAKVFQMNVDDHLFWVAESKVLKGCVGQGETSDEAIKELEENELEWIETAKSVGIPIPAATAQKERTCGGKISLRVSPYVHQNAMEAAEHLGISLNQFINDAVIQYTNDINAFSQTPSIPIQKEEATSSIIMFEAKKRSPYGEVEKYLEEM